MILYLNVQEKWANFHGSWGKRAAEPDYEEIDAAIEQLIPIQQVYHQPSQVLKSNQNLDIYILRRNCDIVHILSSIPFILI